MRDSILKSPDIPMCNLTCFAGSIVPKAYLDQRLYSGLHRINAENPSLRYPYFSDVIFLFVKRLTSWTTQIQFTRINTREIVFLFLKLLLTYILL